MRDSQRSAGCDGIHGSGEVGTVITAAMVVLIALSNCSPAQSLHIHCTSALQWRRDGVCRPGQMSVLPPRPIRSILQSGYFFQDFRHRGVNQLLGSSPLLFPPFLFFPHFSPLPSHSTPLPLPSLKSRPLKSSYKVWGAL